MDATSIYLQRVRIRIEFDIDKKKARVDPEWVENKLIQFIISQIERLNQGKIAAATIANYYKAVKLFCEMNRVRLDWKIIRRSVPTGNKAANDWAPTLVELQKLVAVYPVRSASQIR